MSLNELREQWQDAAEGWQRLRWARTYWQVKNGAVRGTPTDAAHSLNMKPGTYLAYEREPGSSKHTPLDHQAAIMFARKFKVDWQWLLLGLGSPFDNQYSASQERVLRAMSSLDEEKQKAIADFIESTIVPNSTKTGTHG